MEKKEFDAMYKDLRINSAEFKRIMELKPQNLNKNLYFKKSLKKFPHRFSNR